jgi:hypothetical protein
MLLTLEYTLRRKTMDKRPIKITVATLFVVAAAGLASMGVRADDGLQLSAHLSTFNEVPPKGTGAHGTLEANLSGDGTTLSWTLTWTGLTGPPLFAHIHFAQTGVNGGVMTYLCGGPKGNPDIPQKPDCPQTTSGSTTGTTNAGDIIALNPSTSDQGLDEHDFATFLRAIRTGDGYANMHTTRFPSGEIRGQIGVQ